MVLMGAISAWRVAESVAEGPEEDAEAEERRETTSYAFVAFCFVLQPPRPAAEERD